MPTAPADARRTDLRPGERRRRLGPLPVRKGPAFAEVDVGSASSRGRPPERSFLVRLRRGEDSVVVAIGLRRSGAEHVAGRINELLGNTDGAEEQVSLRAGEPGP